MADWDEEATYRAFVADKLTAIHTEVRATNGRVRRHDVAIAILQWGYGLGAVAAAAVFAWLAAKAGMR